VFIVNGSILIFAITVMIIVVLYLVVTVLSLDQLSATLQIPMGYIYLAIPLSGILISFYSVVNISESFTGEGSLMEVLILVLIFLVLLALGVPYSF